MKVLAVLGIFAMLMLFGCTGTENTQVNEQDNYIPSQNTQNPVEETRPADSEYGEGEVIPADPDPLAGEQMPPIEQEQIAPEVTPEPEQEMIIEEEMPPEPPQEEMPPEPEMGEFGEAP